MKTTASWHATTRHFTLSAGFLASALVQTGCFSTSCREEELIAGDDDDVDEVQALECADRNADEQPDCDRSFADALRSQPIVTPLEVESEDDDRDAVVFAAATEPARPSQSVRFAPATAPAPAPQTPDAISNASSDGHDEEEVVLADLAKKPVVASRTTKSPRDPAVESIGETLPPSLMSSPTRSYGASPMGGSVLY